MVCLRALGVGGVNGLRQPSSGSDSENDSQIIFNEELSDIKVMVADALHYSSPICGEDRCTGQEATTRWQGNGDAPDVPVSIPRVSRGSDVRPSLETTDTTTMDQIKRTNGDTVDQIVKLLANERYRGVISYLQQTDRETMSVSELADELPEGVTGKPDRVRLQLRHVILPRLADVGIIDFDARSEMIHYYGRSDVEGVLECIDDIPGIGAGDDL